MSDPGDEQPDSTDDVPITDMVATRENVLAALLGFCRGLRQSGVSVPSNAAITAARALVTVGFGDKDRVRAALQAALISRHEDIATFNRLFPEFWRRLTNGLVLDNGAHQNGEHPDGTLAPMGSSDPPTADDDHHEEDSTAEDGSRWSSTVEGTSTIGHSNEADTETTTTTRYSSTGPSKPLSVSQTRETTLDRTLRRLTLAIAGLETRRWNRSGTDQVYARRALRESISTGGVVVSLPRRNRAEQAVRATLLVDVSQSVLDILDRRFLIRFLRAASAEWRTVRVFFFDTNLREVTEPLHAPTDAAALTALERAETEWGGGTRIGNAFCTIRREHPDTIDRRTVVFVVSDGLEMDDIDRLETGMVWISQRARRTFWLNPLAASPAYEPAARGMATALPYIDGLFAFSSPDDLTEIARQLELNRRSIGYEYDARRTDG